MDTFFFLYIFYIYFIIYDFETFKYEKCIFGRKSNFFFLQIKKYQKLNEIFKIQETKLWKVSLKSVCISRQRSFISKKKEEGWNDGKGRGRPGLSGAVSISISCISSHISRAEVNFFRVDTSNKAFQIYFRREKGEEDVSRVVSSPVHTDNWVVRESFIVQGARLFIPFHSISLHRIPSFDRKRRENDGSQMPPTFFLLFYSHIFIYFLLVYFFFRVYMIYRGNSRRGRHSLIRAIRKRRRLRTTHAAA